MRETDRRRGLIRIVAPASLVLAGALAFGQDAEVDGVPIFVLPSCEVAGAAEVPPRLADLAAGDCAFVRIELPGCLDYRAWEFDIAGPIPLSVLVYEIEEYGEPRRLVASLRADAADVERLDRMFAYYRSSDKSRGPHLEYVTIEWRTSETAGAEYHEGVWPCAEPSASHLSLFEMARAAGAIP